MKVNVLTKTPAELKTFRFAGFASPIMAPSFHAAAKAFFHLKYDAPTLFEVLRRDRSQTEMTLMKTTFKEFMTKMKGR